MSVTTIAPALLEGMRAGLSSMLLAAAASASSALFVSRAGTRDEPMWRTLLVLSSCWFLVAGIARLGGMVADARPELAWMASLVAPVILIAVLALWRFGLPGRTARAFTLAPQAALRLALSPGDAARRLLLLQLLGAAGAGLLLAGAAMRELTLDVMFACGIALWLDGRAPESRVAVAFLLALLATTIAAVADLGREPLVAASALALASVARGVAYLRSSDLA